MTIALNLENPWVQTCQHNPRPPPLSCAFPKIFFKYSQKIPKILLNISKIHYNIMLSLIFKKFIKHAI
jgi:hypothetical protein